MEKRTTPKTVLLELFTVALQRVEALQLRAYATAGLPPVANSLGQPGGGALNISTARMIAGMADGNQLVRLHDLATKVVSDAGGSR